MTHVGWAIAVVAVFWMVFEVAYVWVKTGGF